MDILQIFVFLILFVFSGYISIAIGVRLNIKAGFLVALFLWHTGFCFLYYYMTTTTMGDLMGYWESSFVDDFDFSPGTEFVTSLTKIFSDSLGLTIENTLLIYNFIGVIGLFLLGHVLIIYWPYKGKLQGLIPYILLLLPGISYWTSAIGKDSIAFFAASLALFASINIEKRHYLFAIASIVMFVVRPHIAAIMLLSLALSLVLDKKAGLLNKLFLVSIVSLIGMSMIPFAIDYIGLGEATSIGDANEYMESRQGYNQEGGGGINISSLTLPEQLFAYLFRPLFFDAPGALGIIVSFENLFILIVFCLFFLKGIVFVVQKRPPGAIYHIIFFTIGLCIMATTSANLGISIRQKTMLLPSFFYLLVLSAYYLKASKIIQKPSHRI